MNAHQRRTKRKQTIKEGGDTAFVTIDGKVKKVEIFPLTKKLREEWKNPKPSLPITIDIQTEVTVIN